MGMMNEGILQMTTQTVGTTVEKPREQTANADQILIERCLEGEGSAFTELVNRYRRQVYAVAYRITGNHEEADDLTQESFIRAYRNLGKFRGEASFKNWLLRITTNLSINVKKSGRVSKDVGGEPEDGQLGSEEEPGHSLIEAENRKALHQAIGQLPNKQRQALILKTYEEMTCEQVAEVMKCSVGTVKANVFNALKKLKTIMSQGG